MYQVVQNLRAGRTEVEQVPAPMARPGGVLVRNHFSLISAGTERMVVESTSRGLLSTARQRPDLVRRTLDMVRRDGISSTVQAVMSRLDAPVPLGYSCAGEVVEVGAGVNDFAPGDLAACAGAGYAVHAEYVAVPRNLSVRVPSGVSPLPACFVTLGAIAMQGVRVAEVRLGEAVAVIGLGLVGQLTVQLLKASGCRVFGIDLDQRRVELAQELGADAALPRQAPELLDACARFGDGHGMDAVVVTADTPGSDPIELAGQIARDRAVVSAVGAVGLQVPRDLYYSKELRLQLSRSYGPGRYDPSYEEQGVDYPIGYVRWTERRNMEAFLDLVARGAVSPERLVSHRFPIQQAEQAYDVVAGRKAEPYLAIVLEYPLSAEAPERVVRLGHPPSPVSPLADGRVRESVGVGVVGAGSFARAVLLPGLRAARGARMVGLAAATGVSAQRTAGRFGFQLATTDYQELLSNPEVEAVVVATRHNLHASIAAEALQAGKAVLLEKPMAMNLDELRQLLETWHETRHPLLVGFNRRFAPLARKLREFFSDRRSALALSYRVNAPPLVPDSWIRDPAEGGGPILAEVCHFVDFLHFLVGQPCTRVFASRVGSASDDLPDSVQVQLEFGDGSTGTISYTSDGDRAVSKERLELIGDRAVAVLDDFTRLDLVRDGRRRKFGGALAKQDKGHRAEIEAFLAAVRGVADLPVTPSDSALSTLATLRILDSLRAGAPVELRADELNSSS